jgi:hypothetical protein
MALRMQRRCAEQDNTWFSRFASISSFVLAILLTSVASAQAGHEVSLARALFEEGVTMADKGDWEGAADRFGRAHALKPTSGIAFNWASALAATGKLSQASELLQIIVRDPAADAGLKQECELKLAELAPRMARLKLHVDASLADSTIKVDGNTWPRPVWDVAMPVDPGEHVATGSKGEQELARVVLSLSEGELREIELSPPTPVAAPAVPVVVVPPPAPIEHSERPSRPLYKNWVLWTAVGAVVVGGAVAAVVLSTKGGDTRMEPPATGNTGPGVLRW